MSIKPRDYRQGTYKWRSTPSGSLPLDSDLEHTLLNGLYGTYMPTWRALDERSRRDVIAYIKTFSPRFATEKPQDPIVIPPDPGLQRRVGRARRRRCTRSTTAHSVMAPAGRATARPRMNSRMTGETRSFPMT